MICNFSGINKSKTLETPDNLFVTTNLSEKFENLVVDILTSRKFKLLVKLINKKKISKNQYLVRRIFHAFMNVLKQYSFCLLRLVWAENQTSKLSNLPLIYLVYDPGHGKGPKRFLENGSINPVKSSKWPPCIQSFFPRMRILAWNYNMNKDNM